MYQCDCKTRYDLTSKHHEHLAVVCNRAGVASSIIICPGCHRARIVGCEADWDEVEGKPCFVMFGFEVTDENVHALMSFMGKREE